MALKLKSHVLPDPVILAQPERIVAYWPISEGNCIISLDTGRECSVAGSTEEIEKRVQEYMVAEGAKRIGVNWGKPQPNEE